MVFDVLRSEQTSLYLARTLRWRHNGHDGVSNHQPHDCLLNRLLGCRLKKTSKLRVTGLCKGNSPVTGELPHKRPVTRKMFPFDDVTMILNCTVLNEIIVFWLKRSSKNQWKLTYVIVWLRRGTKPLPGLTMTHFIYIYTYIYMSKWTGSSAYKYNIGCVILWCNSGDKDVNRWPWSTLLVLYNIRTGSANWFPFHVGWNYDLLFDQVVLCIKHIFAIIQLY